MGRAADGVDHIEYKNHDVAAHDDFQYLILGITITSSDPRPEASLLSLLFPLYSYFPFARPPGQVHSLSCVFILNDSSQ